MGAAPRTSPTPEQVAHSFVAVYYRVAAKLPKRLGEFYGSSSELDHGHALRASGSEIAQLGHRLPIAGCAVTVSRLSVQTTGDGAYLVVVIGAYVKSDEKIAFTQTFVLEKQVDSHNEHFFCRNDIFAPISETEGNAVIISVSGTPETHAEPPQQHPDTPATHDEHVEPVQTVKVPTPSPVTPVKQSRHPESVSADVLDPASDTSAISTVADLPSATLPDSAINGAAAHLETESVPESDTAASHEIVSTGIPAEMIDSPTTESPKELATAETLISTEEKQDNAESQKRSSVPPPKKTWASIVSSREDGAHESAAVPEIAAVAEEATYTPQPKDQVENVSPNNESEVKGASQNVSQRSTSGQNGHRPLHHANRGSQRVFGPTAVVQLSAQSQSHFQDTRSLVSCLREEFGTYGHKLRNVDVKAQKGIAFVEYETLDGVKAAVAQWANGPPTKGAFAGIELQVSEKRPFYGGRRPGSMRGGRGGARGSRRGRPNSTPMS